jgi:predicted enzyme related to lactoylglutathione lyase
MASPIAWFDNQSKDADLTAGFYAKTLGLSVQQGPGFPMLSSGDGPFASVSASTKESTGWIPYFEVADLEASEHKARENGGEVVEERQRGPAGEFVIVQDPGGTLFALWKRG